MTTIAATIVGALIGFLASATAFLAYSLSRTRERLAKLEQRQDDRNGLHHHRGE